MADFSTRATDIETSIAPAATLVQPITGEGKISALNQIGRGVEQAAKVFQTVRVNSANLEANKFRADFSIKLNNLQDAHDQGTISDAEFRTRSRAYLSQSLANGPAQTDDLLADYSKFQNQSGLDKIAAPGVQRAELKQAAVKSAVDNGFISIADVGDTEKEEQAIAKLDKFNSSLRDLKEQTDQIALESSKLELGSKQRIDKQAQLQEVTTNGLAKVGRDAMPYWQAQYENIKIKASQASSEQERRAIIEEGVRKLDTDYAQRVASISGDTLGVDQARIDQVFKPQRNLLDTYIKELNGEYSTESYERFTKNAQAQATMLAMEGLDGQTRQWIAISEIAKSAGPVFANKVASGVVKAFEQNARAAQAPKQGVGINQLEVGDRAKPYDPLPSSAEEKKSTQDYLNGVTQIIEDRTGGKFDQLSEPEKKNLDKEIQDQLTSIFRGVDVYSNSSESAKEFQPIIDFLANPTIGDYLQGGKVPKEVQGKIAQVLQDGYSSQVIPMLQKELGDTRFNQVQIDGKAVDISTMVDPTMEGGRFGFKLKPEYQDSFVAKSSLRKLNDSSFSKVLNKMIISDAHIRGDTDYTKSFENTFKPSLFPDADGDGNSDKVDPQKTGSVESDGLDELAFSENDDVIGEVMAANELRKTTPGVAGSVEEDDDLDISSKRGSTPDVANVRGEVLSGFKELQKAFGKKIPVVSGYRDPARNKKAGGAKKSQHMHGNALDIDVSDMGRTERQALIKLAREMGFTGIGVYANSLHIDKGNKRAWGPSFHKESIPAWAMAALGD